MTSPGAPLCSAPYIPPPASWLHFPSWCEEKLGSATNIPLWLCRAARCPGPPRPYAGILCWAGRLSPPPAAQEPHPAHGGCLRESRRHGVFIRTARSSFRQLWSHGSWLSLEQALCVRTLCSFSFWQNTRLELFFSSSFSQTSSKPHLPLDLPSSNTNLSVINGETPPAI